LSWDSHQDWVNAGAMPLSLQNYKLNKPFLSQHLGGWVRQEDHKFEASMSQTLTQNKQNFSIHKENWLKYFIIAPASQQIQ
jgi:hypothetical protein